MSEWISVDEELPGLGEVVMVSRDSEFMPRIAFTLMRTFRGGVVWIEANRRDSHEIEDVTHWMPLPEAPE